MRWFTPLFIIKGKKADSTAEGVSIPTGVLFVDGNFANQVTSLFWISAHAATKLAFLGSFGGSASPVGAPVGLCQSSHGIGGLLIVELVQGAQGFPSQLQITHGVIALHGLVEVGVLRI